jgi:hypothetical protein
MPSSFIPGAAKKSAWPLERFVELFHYLQKHTGVKGPHHPRTCRRAETQKAFEEIQWTWDQRPLFS